MKGKYLIIDAAILPEVFTKVIVLKELLRTGKVKDISEGVRQVGISRSTYYKYKDSVFTISEGIIGHKVTLGLILEHEAGTLSRILDIIALRKGNILTINQDIPINNAASVTITLDASKLETEIDELVEELRNIGSVVRVELITVE